MAVFWFLAGAVTAVAALIIAMPWLRKWPRFGSLPLLPWQASLGAGLVVLAVFGSSHWLGTGRTVTSSGVAAPGNIAAGAFGSAVQVYDRATDGSAMAAGSAGNMPGAANAGAGSMDSAIANLEARLAKGGGSADDWELLAKAFEFLGRPADAAKARAHQLPAPGANPEAATAKSIAAAAAARHRRQRRDRTRLLPGGQSQSRRDAVHLRQIRGVARSSGRRVPRQRRTLAA